MSGSSDIVLAIHNAFRRDMSQIDDSVFKIVHDGGDFAPIFDRLRILNEVLYYHAKGEEAAVFPAVDNLAPLVSKTYLIDHHELDSMANGLKEMQKAPDSLAIARATAVMRSHLRIHLGKEDVQLYPFLWEHTTDDEQVSIARLMSQKVPPDKFPTLAQWMFPLLELDDQVAVTKGWMKLMPPQIFANAKLLIEKAVTENWTEITRRIPELSQ